MSTISTTRETPSVTNPSRATGAPVALARTGAIAGAAAAVATTTVAVIGKTLDIPLEAAPRTADAARVIPLSGFAMGTLWSTAIGVVLAIALARWARRPARTFAIVTVVLTGASLAGPISTGHATTATRLVLELTHVVAAAIVIPALARELDGRRLRP